MYHALAAIPCHAFPRHSSILRRANMPRNGSKQKHLYIYNIERSVLRSLASPPSVAFVPRTGRLAAPTA